MDYSEKINTHINAIRHYILAEADSTDPFVTDKEKYDAMGEIMNSHASRVSHVFNDRGFSTGFSGFLDRFVPAFVFGPESEQYEMSGIFFPFFDFFVVSSESDAYRHRLSVLADGKLLEKLEKQARLMKIAEKYSISQNGISVSFSTDAYQMTDEFINELMSKSVLLFNGKSIDLSDRSEENQKALDSLLMDAVFSRYPKNVASSDFDSAMMHVIQACDTEKKKIMLSDRDYFENTFSEYPYRWARCLIREAWTTAIEEEIMIPEEDE